MSLRKRKNSKRTLKDATLALSNKLRSRLTTIGRENTQEVTKWNLTSFYWLNDKANAIFSLRAVSVAFVTDFSRILIDFFSGAFEDFDAVE